MTLKKYIPDTITSMNLLCGALGVIFTWEDRIPEAFLLMLGAAVFDFLDGFAARALHASSGIGKELDSLCDMVSFGLLPALMLCRLMPLPAPWRYLPLLLAVFSAIRLARFNLDERQHTSFLGLATPACAILCGALACYVRTRPESFLAVLVRYPATLPVLTLVLCVLLLCEIPMFSFKRAGEDGAIHHLANLERTAFFSIAALALISVAVARQPLSLAVLFIVLAYILVNLVFHLFRSQL